MSFASLECYPPAAQVWRLYSALLLQQTPTQLAAPVTDMLRALSPYAPPLMRPLLANADARQSWCVARVALGAPRCRQPGRQALAASDTVVVSTSADLTHPSPPSPPATPPPAIPPPATLPLPPCPLPLRHPGPLPLRHSAPPHTHTQAGQPTAGLCLPAAAEPRHGRHGDRHHRHHAADRGRGRQRAAAGAADGWRLAVGGCEWRLAIGSWRLAVAGALGTEVPKSMGHWIMCVVWCGVAV